MAQEESLATVASKLRTDAFENQTQNLFLGAVGLQCKQNSLLYQVSYIKVRVLVGKEWDLGDLGNWTRNGDI